MDGQFIRIPKPWDDNLKNLTQTGEMATEGFKATGVSSTFIRRPETPTWKKPETPETTAQDSSK